jgi:hypothetical protein
MSDKKTGTSKPPQHTAKAAKDAKTPSHAPPPKPIQRRDATGHLDPRYAAHLRAESGQGRDSDDNHAFLPEGHSKSKDDFAEELGEEAVAAMTSGEYQGEEELDQVVEEERGGPFVESTAGVEYAEGTDPSNPSTATREPFPKT